MKNILWILYHFNAEVALLQGDKTNSGPKTYQSETFLGKKSSHKITQTVPKRQDISVCVCVCVFVFVFVCLCVCVFA